MKTEARQAILTARCVLNAPLGMRFAGFGYLPSSFSRNSIITRIFDVAKRRDG